MRKNLKYLMLLTMIASLLAMTGCKSSDYKNARKQYDNQEYAAAAETFKALGDYKDSAEMYIKATDQLLMKNVVGSWNGKLDFSSMLEEPLAEKFDSSVLRYIDLSQLNIPYAMVCNDDNTFDIRVDAASTEVLYDSVGKVISDGLIAYITDETIRLGNNLGFDMENTIATFITSTVKTFLEAQVAPNITEFLQKNISEDTIDTLVNTFKSSGVYSVENGEITFKISDDIMKGTYQDDDTLEIIRGKTTTLFTKN